MFRFNRTYLILAVILFFIEVYIALYVHDAIVRPYVGDLLVVILIYCFVKAFVNTPPLKTAMGVLIFAYIVELSQYLKLIKLLGLEKSRLANMIIGNSFEWIDMIAYTLGAVIVVAAEYYAARMRTRKVIRNIEL
jgi:DNA integrity scanning protein DisA with diadenylate cyclase activity